MLTQQLRNRRHDPGQRSLPILHQPTVRLQIKPGHQTDICPQPAAHGEADIQRIHVRQRREEDLTLTAAPVLGVVVVQLVAGCDEVVVREHHCLGDARCAAGEEDGCAVVGVAWDGGWEFRLVLAFIISGKWE